MSCSKVTETLWQQVAQMKAKGVILSALTREVCCFKSMSSSILHLYNVTHIQVPQEDWSPMEDKCRN